MTEYTPIDPEDSPDDDSEDIAFTPVRLRYRYDGWTGLKQVEFIEALAETACVEDACKRVGMTVQSAYRLRRRECGLAFRRAWEEALDYGVHRLEEAAMSRALNGVARPIFYKGEQIGEWREYDERLTMFILRHRRPDRFGRWIERLLAPEPFPHCDPGYRLAGVLDVVEERGPDEDGNFDGFE